MRKLFIKTDAAPDHVIINGVEVLDTHRHPVTIKAGLTLRQEARFCVQALFHGGFITTITTIAPFDKTLRVRVVVDSFKPSEVGEIEALMARLEFTKVASHSFTAMVQREVTMWHLEE